ncbi:hypothetical protein R3P38DRAFT_3170912 [Favolaschia claudopus]|uniref:Uncharacterized protein n=1 Tax=Favolaschia claudopus TaxID=2862362 RepID=A0AAW0DL77_9AGAR
MHQNLSNRVPFLQDILQFFSSSMQHLIPHPPSHLPSPTIFIPHHLQPPSNPTPLTYLPTPTPTPHITLPKVKPRPDSESSHRRQCSKQEDEDEAEDEVIAEEGSAAYAYADETEPDEEVEEVELIAGGVGALPGADAYLYLLPLRLPLPLVLPPLPADDVDACAPGFAVNTVTYIPSAAVLSPTWSSSLSSAAATGGEESEMGPGDSEPGEICEF